MCLVPSAPATTTARLSCRIAELASDFSNLIAFSFSLLCLMLQCDQSSDLSTHMRAGWPDTERSYQGSHYGVTEAGCNVSGGSKHSAAKMEK
jgi:hypothetical protein